MRKSHDVASLKTREIARPTPPQRDRALRLLLHEAHGDESAEALAAAAERVCQHLSHQAGEVLGIDTFYALLARALTLVTPDFPFLGVVSVERSLARLMGLRESLQEQAPSQVADAGVAVVATFLALLADLIGEQLSLSVLVKVGAEGSVADVS